MLYFRINGCGISNTAKTCRHIKNCYIASQKNMFNQYLQDQNFLALAVAALVNWIIGSAWFSILFGKPWMQEVEKTGYKLEKPSSKEFGGMMIGTFIYTLVITFALSYIIFVTGCINFASALKMGALIGLCISWATIGITYTWVKRSMKLLAIDAGYHTVGVIAASLILGLWR